MSHITLKNLPESERPYERFQQLGAEALSDAELLAIILKTGTKDLTSLDLIQLCRNNDRVVSLRHDPIVHHLIIR